jgi:multiple sugar transport system substrate-binding protein
MAFKRQTTPLISRRAFNKAAAAAPLAVGATAVFVPTAIRAQDRTEIRMATYTISEAWDSTIQALIDEFNAQSDSVSVNLEFRPGDQYWDKIQTEYAGGQAPDITLNQINWLVPGASRGMFVDLKPYYERDEIDLSDLWYDMEQEWAYEDGMYGALLYAGGQALYYNKGLLEAAGESPPSADWTWDDLLISSQALTNVAEDQFGVTLSMPNPPYWGCSFIHGAGGTVLNDARDECTLNSPESRAALQWLVDLTFEHNVAPIMIQEDGAENLFLAGRIAYYFGGTWEEAAIRSSDLDWDFLPMPAHPETGIRSVQMGSNAWSILSTTSDADAAWEVVKYIGGPEGAAGVSSLGIPGYRSVIESEEFLEMHAPQDITIPVSDFEQYGHDYYGTEDSGEWWNAVTQELGPMWTGEDSVENATQRATDAVNEIFSRRGSF